MSDKEAVSSKDKLELYSNAFETFEQTIEKLEISYSELEERFSDLDSELELTNEKLREALEEKERARSFLNNVLTSVSSGIVAYNTKGRISHMNRAARRLLECDEDAVGLRASELGIVDSRNQISAAATIATGEEFDSEEKALELPSGRRITVAVSTSVMKDYAGQDVGVVEVMHDLTKLRELEGEVARVRALAALGEISATVAHEVRNPLGGIAGFASLLKRDLPKNHEGQRLVDKILTGVENLDKSVSSLLMYARDISPAIRDVNVYDFVRELSTFFAVDANHAKGNYNLSVEVTNPDLTWRFDPEFIRQGMLNLLNNAVQAMPTGGEVRLVAKVDDSLYLSVHDQGDGVSDDIRGKIFTPFFTTKKGGTGLGLATVRKIAEAHGGEIEVCDNDNRGTVFTVVLPKR